MLISVSQMKIKACALCGVEKDESEYHADTSSPDGLFAICKPCRSARSSAWYSANREREMERNRRWHAANKERRLVWARAYAKRLPEQARVANRLRSRINVALRTCKGSKSGRTNSLLGCSYRYLMRYIEARFEPGMTWANHGSVWHLDHVIPCALFDLTKADQQRKCFHHTNLQPLFAYDNLKKSAKVLRQTTLCV